MLLPCMGDTGNGVNDVHTLFFSFLYRRDSSSAPGISGHFHLRLGLAVAPQVPVMVHRPY